MTAPSERAILAGGCFWGMQHLLRRHPGVIATRVGYTGPTCPTRPTAITEPMPRAIEIVFDPRTITYRRVLEFFFELELAQERRFALDEQLHGREA